MLLPIKLKDAATEAFQDNRKLAAMSAEERELAAQGYEQMAEQMGGTEAALARLYDLERAKFLRGQVSRIASKARMFGEEIGYSRTGDAS